MSKRLNNFSWFRLSLVILLLGLLIGTLGLWQVSAQESTDEPPSPEPQPQPPTITDVAPREVVSGAGGVLSLFGSDFEQGTTVYLDGVGLLETMGSERPRGGEL